MQTETETLKTYAQMSGPSHCSVRADMRRERCKRRKAKAGRDHLVISQINSTNSYSLKWAKKYAN